MIPSQENFKAWFAEQPGDRKFCYTSNTHCLIASWLKETKVSDNVCVYTTCVTIDGDNHTFPWWLQDLDSAAVHLNGALQAEFTVKDLRAALQTT